MPKLLFVATVLISLVVADAYRTNFQWRTSMDRTTGMAASTETSNVPITTTKNLSVVEETFSAYPTWLAKPRVTFGILRARRKDDGSVCVQDRIFGLNILTFGKHKQQGKNTVVLPVVGGLAALPDESSNKYQGSLVFSLQESILETKISSGYRPFLAGRPPVPLLRTWMYRSTQSMIHAYVMWRFHRYCRSSFTREIES